MDATVYEYAITRGDVTAAAIMTVAQTRCFVDGSSRMRTLTLPTASLALIALLVITYSRAETVPIRNERGRIQSTAHKPLHFNSNSHSYALTISSKARSVQFSLLSTYKYRAAAAYG